ncbi:integrase, catalytic region, zinc finger, CCHC-type containing protein [Tanacetum coccineum]
MQNPEDISDPTTAIDMALVLIAKAFKLNNNTPTYNNQISLSNPRNMQIAQPGMNMDQVSQMLMVEDNVGNQFRPNAGQIVGDQLGHTVVQNLNIQKTANQSGNGNVVATPAEGNGNGNNENQIRCYNCLGVDHYARNCTVNPKKRDVAYLQTQPQIAQKEEAEIQLNFKEFDFMAAAGAYDEIEEVNANCTFKDNLKQASTSEEQYTELLKPISELHQGQQNDSNVIYVVSSMEQSRGTIEQNTSTVEETRAYFESLYNNLAIEVEKVNTVNRKMKETNIDLTTELAGYKNQEKCFEIHQEKYDKLERCYQKFVYQEQCLAKKINAIYLSSTKTITTLNEEIANLNNKLSKEKSTVSFLNEEKKKLKSDFKIREKELLDKQI